MNVSSVSPLQPIYDKWISQTRKMEEELQKHTTDWEVYLRWLVITPQPARFDIFTASMLSVTDQIWLTYNVNGRQNYSADALWLFATTTKYKYLKPPIPWGEGHCRTSQQLPLQLSAENSEIHHIIHRRKWKDKDNISQKGKKHTVGFVTRRSSPTICTCSPISSVILA